MSAELRINDHVLLPGSELSWTAVRSGGPGGQNVNKLATKVELRFDLPSSRSLDAGSRSRLTQLARGRLDSEGRIVVVCQETRNQARNLELARAALAELVRRALVVPRRRRKTRRPVSADRTRLDDKRRQSQKKKSRHHSRLDDG